jgi:hypothetical protein
MTDEAIELERTSDCDRTCAVAGEGELDISEYCYGCGRTLHDCESSGIVSNRPRCLTYLFQTESAVQSRSNFYSTSNNRTACMNYKSTSRYCNSCHDVYEAFSLVEEVTGR